MSNTSTPLNNKAYKESLVQLSTEESRWQETIEALDSVKAGRSIDCESLHKWLASWGSSNKKSCITSPSK